MINPYGTVTEPPPMPGQQPGGEDEQEDPLAENEGDGETKALMELCGKVLNGIDAELKAKKKPRRNRGKKPRKPGASNAGGNCGTGAGGFKPGNTCGRRGDAAGESAPPDKWAWKPSREKPLPPPHGDTAPAGDVGELIGHLKKIRKDGASAAEAERTWNDGMKLIAERGQTFPGNGPVVNDFYGVVTGGWRVYVGLRPFPGANTNAIAFNHDNNGVALGKSAGIRTLPLNPEQRVLFHFKQI